jgi:hypothetical protein
LPRLLEWTRATRGRLRGGGIPHQRHEIGLLFKAKHTREKEHTDLDAVLPLLEPDARRWLAEALEVVHPAHPWIETKRGES